MYTITLAQFIYSSTASRLGKKHFPRGIKFVVFVVAGGGGGRLCMCVCVCVGVVVALGRGVVYETHECCFLSSSNFDALGLPRWC